jgi:hypothetical protein
LIITFDLGRIRRWVRYQWNHHEKTHKMDYLHAQKNPKLMKLWPLKLAAPKKCLHPIKYEKVKNG